MFFPIGDTQVKGGFKPIFSYSFIGLNIAIFLVQLAVPGNLVCEYSTIPDEILTGKDYYTLITSMFLHGGWMHLIGNMLFLWVFGDNIEATIGSLKFLIFYLLGGIAASAIHIYFNQGGTEMLQCCLPCEPGNSCQMIKQACPRFTPSLGASGAISAVMGAYLVMFPKSQIKILILIFFNSVKIPALLFLGMWFAWQLFCGIGDLSITAQTSGVAWWAHIGGFVFGVLVGFLFRNKAELKSSVSENTGDFV